MKTPTLLLCLADAVHVDGSVITMAAKTQQGIDQFVSSWPGRVAVHAPRTDKATKDLQAERSLADLEFDLLSEGPASQAARQLRPEVVLALHREQNYELLDIPETSVVWTFEMPLSERRLLSSAGASPIDRFRIAAGSIRRRPAYRASLRRAAGVQCNGLIAHREAAGLAKSDVLYFDHRVPSAVIESSQPVRMRAGDAIRWGFSGRHTLIKGPQYAVELANELDRRSLGGAMTIYGSGEMTPELQARVTPGVTFAGSLPFVEEWIPSVRREVDVMVLPHLQGDPPGTYLESFALGIPVLGFAKSTLAALVEMYGVGWCAPVGDIRALTKLAIRLQDNPEEVSAAGQRALEFMRKHPMETEFVVREHHLEEVANA